jgi:hypothetical protein
VLSQDEGSLQLRLLEAPESRRDDPRARIYIIDHLPPGRTITRKIGITNRSREPLRIALYPGAAEVSDGEFHPLEGRARNDLTTWTRIEPTSVEIEPFDESEAVVTIAVPDDASPGERYGAVWAELPRPEGPGAGAINRVGIRIYLSVGEGGEPASDFEIDQLTPSRAPDGAALVTAKVRNTGGRALDLSGELTLAGGPGGLTAGPFPARLGTTLGIDQDATVFIPVDKEVPNGPWDAKLTLASGTLERTAEARITFPGAGRAGSAVDTESGDDKLGLILGALAILIALVLFLFFLLKRRRKRGGRGAVALVHRSRGWHERTPRADWPHQRRDGLGRGRGG